MNKKELEGCARKCLIEGFPLFLEEHDVHAHVDDKGATVTYRIRRGVPIDETHFDIEFIGPICHINHIEIEPNEQEKGNGRKFYSVVENIDREYGSERVRATASGKMRDGRTKTQYMESLGYSRVEKAIEGVENENTPWVVEKILK